MLKKVLTRERKHREQLDGKGDDVNRNRKKKLNMMNVSRGADYHAFQFHQCKDLFIVSNSVTQSQTLDLGGVKYSPKFCLLKHYIYILKCSAFYYFSILALGRIITNTCLIPESISSLSTCSICRISKNSLSNKELPNTGRRRG